MHGRCDGGMIQSSFDRRFEAAAGQSFNKPEARFVTVGTKEMMRNAEDMLTDSSYPMPDQALLVY